MIIFIELKRIEKIYLNLLRKYVIMIYDLSSTEIKLNIEKAFLSKVESNTKKFMKEWI